MSKTIYHNHHIVPKHMGGTDDPSNLIKLTIEEHAEAHRILYEKYGLWQDKLAWQGLSKMIDKQELISILQSNAAKDRLVKYGNPLIGIKTKGNFKLNPDNHIKAITLAQSKEAIAKRKNTLKNINHQKGDKNSQFGKHIYVPANIIKLPSNSELNSDKHKFKINEQPHGWILISEWRESRKNKSNGAYGKHWYNDGTNNYLIFENESFGLVRGRLINNN